MVNNKLAGKVQARNGLDVLFYKPLEATSYDYVCAWSNGEDVWGWSYHKIDITQGKQYIRKDGMWFFLENMQLI